MDQHQFLIRVLAYYKENDLTPGNPEDGVWHEAHYPTPKCLGGTETVLLLEEHHAVQGVLQSEEFNHPCIFGWGKVYLKGVWKNLLSKHQNWMREKGKKAAAAGHTEEINKVRSEWNKEFLPALITGEDNYAWGLNWYHNSMGENKRFLSYPGEGWSPGMKKKGYTDTKFKCTETGYVSNAGGLSHYQKKRGINPLNRVRLE
jgi:hypothetical protein